MSKFKGGDRIVAYLCSDSDAPIKLVGKVFQVIDHERIRMAIDRSGYRTFHEKQCRKLVKKERRRVWICENETLDEFPNRNCHLFTLPPDPIAYPNAIEFVEAKKKL